MKKGSHPSSFLLQESHQSLLLLCGDKGPLTWASKGLLTALGLLHLSICLPPCPLTFPGMSQKSKDAFNNLYLTRLEINLLVSLSHWMWNNRSSGDVTFLVGEHIKGARLQPSPWTPKGISSCQVSLVSTGAKQRGRKPKQVRRILHTKGRYFSPLLLQSYALHYAWLFNI